MELCEEGDLDGFLKRRGGRLQEHEAQRITKDVLKGLLFMSEKCHVMHWDIKLENILVKRRKCECKEVRDFEFKIGDMGLAKGHQSGDNALQ